MKSLARSLSYKTEAKPDNIRVIPEATCFVFSADTFFGGVCTDGVLL